MPRTTLPMAGANKRCAEHNLYDLRDRFPTTGNIWFVDSGAASGGNGLSPEGAVTTIDAAINLCTASNGDIIIVMEGHAESVVGAAGIALDVAGVTIVGLGRGRNRPVVTFTTATGASLDISGANCHVENLALVNGIASQTAMVNVTGAGVTIRNCEFQLSDGSTAAVLGILTTDAADRLLVEDCHFHGTAAVTGAIRIVGTDDTIVRRNVMTGLYAVTGALEQVTTAGDNHIYQDNVIINRTADGNNKTITVKSDTTAFLVGNRMAIIDSTGPAPVTAAGGYVSHNYWTGAVGVTASTLM